MKLLVFIILCAVPNILMAQEQFNYRYWFDSADNSAVTGTSSNYDIQTEIDVSQLGTGLHSFNYQIIGHEDGESTVKSKLFYKTAMFLNGNGIVYIDGKSVESFSISANAIEIDTDSLDLGFHFLSVQLIDDNGGTASPEGAFFMRMPTTENLANMQAYYFIDDSIEYMQECSFVDNVVHLELDMTAISEGLHTVTMLLNSENGLVTQSKSAAFIKSKMSILGEFDYRYWFDAKDDLAVTGKTSNGLFQMDIDASTLETGLHSFNYQIVDTLNGASSVRSKLFYKTASLLNKQYVVLIDGVPTNSYTISENTIEIDANDLDIGIHSMSIQVIDDNGGVSCPEGAFFMKVPTTDDLKDMTVYYIVDDDIEGKKECSFVDNIANVELDMSSLEDGTHTITFQLVNKKGFVSETKTATFIKDSTITGIDEITINEEWLNSNKVYDLQGRRILNIPMPGIYIIKDKKYRIQ